MQPRLFQGDPAAEEEILLTSFKDALKSSEHIIVIAGPGLSAPSGIPTFRDGAGMWQSLNAKTLATPSMFAADPSTVWKFYHYRRVKVLEAKPNKAHDLLAKLSVPSILKTVAPVAESFHLITQNVDGPSLVALKSLAEQLSHKKNNTSGAYADQIRMDSVLQMHGNLFNVECTKCGYSVEDLSNPLCPALGAVDAQQDYRDAGSESKENDILEEDLPRCRACGALARPGVVWFDEKPKMLDEINRVVHEADLCLVIGTSSMMRPALAYAYRVRRRKGKVAIFDLQPSEGDEEADFIFPGPCAIQLSRAFPELDDIEL